MLFAVIDEYAKHGPGYTQAGGVLQEVARRLNLWNKTEAEQALLTLWSDLFRQGYLSWGYNLANANPPFFHISQQGRIALQNYSRDPANPDGYLAHLGSSTILNPVAKSYIAEAVQTFNSGCIKATAVMVGAAAESVALDLRDGLIARLNQVGKTPTKDLKDWRIKTVLDATQKELEARMKAMPPKLAESLQAYWPAFVQQIRAARNDAGHPSTLEPVTFETVHASLLIFPELAKLAGDLKSWIDGDLQ